MTRLEELFLKWQDRDITDAELRELNTALIDPAGRKQLWEAFRFDGQLLQSLQSLAAIDATTQSIQDFETLELRTSELFATRAESGNEWMAHLRRWFGCRRAALAYGCAFILAAGLALAFFASSKKMAVLEGNIAGVTVLRGNQAMPAKAGFVLQAGDRVKTSGDNNAFIRYAGEPTQIKLLAGTQLKLDQEGKSKHLEVLVGTISAKVAPQPPGHPMLVGTPHSDAKIIGTEFVLTVDSASTHLEVIEGATQLCNREDGKAVVGGRDHFATVAKGTDLVPRSLLPPPWSSQDIGAVGMTGYARIEGHRCKIKAAGKPDSKSKDQYHFLY